jgi:hypothetical protein
MSSASSTNEMRSSSTICIPGCPPRTHRKGLTHGCGPPASLSSKTLPNHAGPRRPNANCAILFLGPHLNGPQRVTNSPDHVRAASSARSFARSGDQATWRVAFFVREKEELSRTFQLKLGNSRRASSAVDSPRSSDSLRSGRPDEEQVGEGGRSMEHYWNIEESRESDRASVCSPTVSVDCTALYFFRPRTRERKFP